MSKRFWRLVVAPSDAKSKKRAAALEGQGDLVCSGGVEETTDVQVGGVGGCSIKSVEHKYTLIESEVQLQAVVDELMQNSEFCFDTETTGLEIFDSELVVSHLRFDLRGVVSADAQ